MLSQARGNIGQYCSPLQVRVRVSTNFSTRLWSWIKILTSANVDSNCYNESTSNSTRSPTSRRSSPQENKSNHHEELRLQLRRRKSRRRWHDEGDPRRQGCRPG